MTTTKSRQEHHAYETENAVANIKQVGVKAKTEGQV